MHSSAFQQVINEVVEFLVITPDQPLPPPELFVGAGIYTLYYTGAFEAYTPISECNKISLAKSIYVEKAVPSGWRQARTTSKISATLYRRLNEHATSLKVVENLELADFQCQFVILQGQESSMISTANRN